MLGPRARSFAVALAMLVAAPFARAQEVVSEKSAAPAKPAATPKPTNGAKPASAPAPGVQPKLAKKKPAFAPIPKKPSSTAAAGSAKASVNEAARKKVAGVSLGINGDDPELEALRDADRVLFPKPLPGSTPGFSWDLPRPGASRGPDLSDSGLPPAMASDPSLGDESESPSDSTWIRSLTLPDLPVRLESRVVRYLKFYRDNPRGKGIARAWSKKSGRYVASLKAELAKAGLPTDLVWLSLIESAHNPSIISPAGAAGLWQFMPESARVYGLTVDRWVDERLDPKRATEAAVLYLADLHRRFGSWELAMAAYNMGYGGLSKAIRKFNTNDYWELGRYEAGIPWETTLYVPKIYAIAIVMANKKAFGLEDVVADPPETFENVVAAPGLSLERAAAISGVPVATLESLNPSLLASRVPPQKALGVSRFKLRVPSGKSAEIGEKLAKAGDPEPDLEPYVVRPGDSLSQIARDRATSDKNLQRLNKIRDDEALGSGTILLVPRRADAKPLVDAARNDDVVVVSPREYRYPDRERVFYRVQGGDTLGTIGQLFGVSKADLESWNSLDPNARLQASMMLQIWIKPGTDLSNVRVLRENETKILVAGSPEFFEHFEGQNGKKRITVAARAGDTLASIGRRYGMSVGWMERINRRSRKKELRPGDKLVVYVASAGLIGKPVALDDGAPGQLPDIDAPQPGVLPSIDGESTEEPRASDKSSAAGSGG